MSDDPYVRTGRIMFIFAWLIFFSVVFLFFYYFGENNKSNYRLQNGQLILEANRQGHYQIPGKINGYPVIFILDTGATLVGIPKSIADEMQLTGRYPIAIQTANGKITGLLTRLDTVSFGEFTIHDVKAVIVPGGPKDVVLMGMNVLNQFNLEQKNRRLIIKRGSDNL